MAYYINDDDYRMLTEFCNRRDNREDGLRRAAILGIGKGSMVAPGALVRIPVDQIGSNVYFGLYSYSNGNVTVGDNVLIGPHCPLLPEITNSIPQPAGFPAEPNRTGTTPLSSATAAGWLPM